MFKNFNDKRIASYNAHSNFPFILKTQGLLLYQITFFSTFSYRKFSKTLKSFQDFKDCLKDSQGNFEAILLISTN
jgi:hypothetical protein